MKIKFIPFLLSILVLCSCNSGTREAQQNATPEVKSYGPGSYPKTGSIERLDPALDMLIPKGAEIEIIAEGFEWAEGPVWVPGHDMLLFSDIPPNKVFKWTEKNGLEEYLHPSGFTGEAGSGNEPGSNGLLLDKAGNLVLCQHGDRRMARMDAPLDQPSSTFVTVADKWEGKRFNSPNDAVYNNNWELFFTDPPYGLPKQEKDPSKEIPFQGVYHFSEETGKVSLLTDQMSRPNGIALSPDEKTLYVANSDPKHAVWMAFDLDGGQVSNGRVFYEVTEKVGKEKGLPDGMKVDRKGNVWATGPGGVWIFSPEGKHLGSIKTGEATANCAFNEDKTVFYMTADMYLMRVVLE